VDPYEGYYARVVQEFAGIGGDTVYGKAEIHSALYHQIWNDLVNIICDIKFNHKDITYYDLLYCVCCILVNMLKFSAMYF